MNSFKGNHEGHDRSFSSRDWRGYSRREIIPDRIYVGNLDTRVTEDELGDFFSNFGAVLHVGIIRYQPNRGGFSNERNYGFVTFNDVQHVDALLSAGDTLKIRGKVLQLGKAKQRKDYDQGRSFNGEREVEDAENDIEITIHNVHEVDRNEFVDPPPSSSNEISTVASTPSFPSPDVVPSQAAFHPSLPVYEGSPPMTAYSSGQGGQMIGVLPDGSWCYLLPQLIQPPELGMGFPLQAPAYWAPDPQSQAPTPCYGSCCLPGHPANPGQLPQYFYPPQFTTYYNHPATYEQQNTQQQFHPQQFQLAEQDLSTNLHDSGFVNSENSIIETSPSDSNDSRAIIDVKDDNASTPNSSFSSTPGQPIPKVSSRQPWGLAREELFKGKKGFSNETGRSSFGNEVKNKKKGRPPLSSNFRGRKSLERNEISIGKEQPDLLKVPLEKLNLNS